MRKSSASCFKGTNLQDMLTTLGVDTLIVTGAVACVALFAIGAVLSLFTGRNAFYGGARMLVIGAGAGILTFAIGSALGVGIG